MRCFAFISFAFSIILFSCSNNNNLSESDKSFSSVENIEIINQYDSSNNDEIILPLHGELNKDKLNLYYPNIMDTIKDLRILGSEILNLNPSHEIIVSLLHNTGTFDQMIICTHDKNLKLIDNLYIGKSTTFDKTSHTIEFEILNENSLKFNHVDWGFVKNKEHEIDTTNFLSYIITIDGKGKISKSNESTR
jgi:hypothetical protein